MRRFFETRGPALQGRKPVRFEGKDRLAQRVFDKTIGPRIESREGELQGGRPRSIRAGNDRLETRTGMRVSEEIGQNRLRPGIGLIRPRQDAGRHRPNARLG